jgi:hypothetical protein
MFREMFFRIVLDNSQQHNATGIDFRVNAR